MKEPVVATRRAITRQRRRQRRKLSAVGIIGEVLITTGFLVFLFLGWQLWLNDIILGDQDNHAAADLAQTWDDGNTNTREDRVLPDFGDPVVTATPQENATFAVMYVPRLGSDWAREVAEGISPSKVLNSRRIGHYPATQLPGAIGNFAVAGHRTTYGAPFKDIDQLRLGDKLYLQTQDGYYTYSFRNLEYVSPHGVGVLEPVPQRVGEVATESVLTITSCNPRFSAVERIIAYAVFESWQPSSAGAPAEISTIVNAKG